MPYARYSRPDVAADGKPTKTEVVLLANENDRERYEAKGFEYLGEADAPGVTPQVMVEKKEYIFVDRSDFEKSALEAAGVKASEVGESPEGVARTLATTTAEKPSDALTEVEKEPLDRSDVPAGVIPAPAKEDRGMVTPKVDDPVSGQRTASPSAGPKPPVRVVGKDADKAKDAR